jgi:hypothetical protein
MITVTIARKGDDAVDQNRDFEAAVRHGRLQIGPGAYLLIMPRYNFGLAP